MFEPEKTATEQALAKAGTKLAVNKYACTAVPYNDSLREQDHPQNVKKGHHNVSCPKDATSKQLPTMSVTFYQKKATPTSDEFEVESTVAQKNESSDEECLSYCEGDEVSERDSVLSDMGTNGSLDCCQLPVFNHESGHEDLEEIKVFLHSQICKNQYKNLDRAELDHYMNVNLNSLQQIDQQSLDSQTCFEDEDFDKGAYSLSFAKAADQQNTSLPNANEAYSFVLQPEVDYATQKEI